ncbi:MAG: response regulator [Polyangiaceae bacterium]|nr:response regulator [Polyangiaceae bacterium]
MKRARGSKESTGGLRRRAEARLSEGSGAPVSGEAVGILDAQRLVHELEVHQIELEVQNEELVRARVELEESLLRYTELYELAPVGYLTLARDGEIRRVNLTGARLLGQDRSRLMGRRLGLFVAGADGHRVEAFLAEVFATTARVSCELSLGPGSAAEYVELTSGTDDRGHECRVAMSDITARRRAEVAQRAIEQRFRALFELSRDALMTMEPPSFRLLSGNAAAVAMFGARDEADLVSQALWDYAPALQPDGRSSSERARETIEAAMHEGTQCIDWTQARRSGEEFPASVRLTRVEVDDQVLLLATVRDETERMGLLASAAQADRLASIGMLAAGVAHEINNPLTFVLYNAETLARDLPSLADATRRCCAALRARVGEAAFAEIAGDGARFLDAVGLDDLIDRTREALSGILRIRDVSAGLGTFSRVESTEPSGTDLNQAVNSAISMAANEIKYRARLVKDLGQVPEVRASGGKLAQVFLNLLINATHAVEEGAVDRNSITVRTWGEGGTVYAEIADTGTGIPAAMLPRIFEPFFSTKRVGRGAGLGLAISRNIVHGFGGEIRVESGLGRGTRFVVCLPVTGSGDEARSPTPVPISAPPVAGIRGRILVVDDEPLLCSALKRVLEKAHDVVTAASGAECRAILERDPSFDLILCDLMMPEMTGMDLHAWLTGYDPLLASRVVFMTGGAFTSRASEYLAQFRNLRLDKPFDFGEVRSLAAKLVSAARSGCPELSDDVGARPTATAGA